VLGLPAGALPDRWDRRRMMLWADAGRALLTAAIPVAHWLVAVAASLAFGLSRTVREAGHGDVAAIT
jgi:MFS family permease